MKCNKCGDIITFDNFYTKTQCWNCRREYLRLVQSEPKWIAYKSEWRRTRKWLDGGKDQDGERYNEVHPIYRNIS